MAEDIVEILIKARDESSGETIDIELDSVLPGITKEMYEWWGQHMADTKYYRLWHPAHVSFTREKSDDPNAAPVMNPTEMLGSYGPSTMRFRPNPPGDYPVTPKYKNYRCTTHIAPDNSPLSLLCGEYEESPEGLKLHQLFRWPAKTPKGLVDALVQHIKEEVGNFPKFLPELYRKETGKSA